MKTLKKKASFMNGNLDLEGVVFDTIAQNIGIKRAVEIDFDFDNAIYSDGFLEAINDELIPDFSTLRESCSYTNNKGFEYHHVVVNDICYVVDFVEDLN